MFKDAFNKLIEERETNIFQVSKETKIPVSSMYDWSHGRTKPKFDAIVKIAKYFKVPIEYFAE